MKHEREAIFLGIDKKIIRQRLKEAEFVLEHPECLMRRKTFDFPEAMGIKKKKRWGRVRQEFDKVTMTIKEVRGSGINDTLETELTVSDFDIACIFLRMCGLYEKGFQENMREAWTCNNVRVTIDSWPALQPFLEIEGSHVALVRRTAQKIGLDFSQAVFGSVDLLYEKELGIPSQAINNLPEITFLNPPKKSAT